MLIVEPCYSALAFGIFIWKLRVASNVYIQKGIPLAQECRYGEHALSQRAFSVNSFLYDFKLNVDG